MRKIKYLFALAIISILSLCSCKSSSRIISIEVKDGYNKEVEIANFKYNEYTLICTYSDNSTKEIELTSDMLSEYEQLKFYQSGAQNIIVNYKGLETSFNVNVNRMKFNVQFLDAEYEYDGKAHQISFTGALPRNAVVTYTNGNSFVDTGKYTVEAVVSCPAFETETFRATLTIKRTKIVIPKVIEDEQFTYNGEEVGINQLNVLPDNVVVQYKVNGKSDVKMVNAGTYTITAEYSFKQGARNYEEIPSTTAKYTIIPQIFDLDQLEIERPDRIYSGIDEVFKLKNEFSDYLVINYNDTNIVNITGEDDYGEREVVITVKSINPNYCFEGSNGYTYEKEITREVYISPAYLEE